MGASGTASLNFGAFPGGSDASVAVTGQAGILAGSLVEAWILPADTADHKADEHWLETIKVMAGNIVPGTGFTIYGVNTSEINEPLAFGGISTFRTVVGTVYGYADPSVGGTGTRIYGVFNIGWVWN